MFDKLTYSLCWLKIVFFSCLLPFFSLPHLCVDLTWKIMYMALATILHIVFVLSIACNLTMCVITFTNYIIPSLHGIHIFMCGCVCICQPFWIMLFVYHVNVVNFCISQLFIILIKTEGPRLIMYFRASSPECEFFISMKFILNAQSFSFSVTLVFSFIDILIICICSMVFYFSFFLCV